MRALRSFLFIVCLAYGLSGICLPQRQLICSKSSQKCSDFVKANQLSLQSSSISSRAALDVLKTAYYRPQSAVVQTKHYQQRVKSKSWDEFKSQFLQPYSIEEGRKFIREQQQNFAAAQTTYGVPSNILATIFDIESGYCHDMGNEPVADSIASIAFYDQRRQDFFQNQLLSFIKMVVPRRLNPPSIKGSVDGGMGCTQFMPSNYLLYAVAADGKSTPNLTLPADAIMSTANMLKGLGWSKNAPIAVPVKIPENYCSEHVNVCNSEKLTNTVATWRNLGVVRNIPNDLDSALKAELIFLDDVPAGISGEDGKRYHVAWLGFSNLYVLKAYNGIFRYAIVAYLLSQDIQKS